MAKQRHLNHAPITEALVDIHVKPRDGLSFDAVLEAFGELNFGYYLKTQIAQGRIDFMLPSDGQKPQATAEARQIGIRLHSIDEQYIAQCRLNGLTLSRLPPYEAWDSLLEEVRRLWLAYKQRLEPVCVTRVATRFINNLRLPMEQGTSFQLYLNRFADVPAEAPQAIASIFQRFQLVDIGSEARVNLTLALESASQGEPLPVILDIDAFKYSHLEPEDEKLWKILEDLRDLKNRCFFGSLTEQAIELYK